MSIGFRKSLLGFNREDVTAYLEARHKSYVDKETELSEKIDILNTTISDLQESYDALAAEKSLLENELKQYAERYEEINRLSENIGKLYLVAQTNAQAVMQNSTESRMLARDEIQKNISTLTEAHQSLEALKCRCSELADQFTAEMDELLQSLNTVREKITVNNQSSEDHIDEFDTVFQQLAK